MRYFLVVGEASADLHASRLMEALKAKDAEASFAFMGGDLMAQVADCSPIVHYREVSFMGIIPVLKNLSKIRRVAKELQQAIRSFQPDVVIPIDFAGFNLRYILPFVKRHLSCPIHYYIAPKLWAWQSWRIKTLRKYVDLLLCILPFEESYFTERGIHAIYVGNPCVDATLPHWEDPVQAKRQIALLPGSRIQELKSNLPTMLESVSAYQETWDIVVAGAPSMSERDYQAYLASYPGVKLVFGCTYRLLRESRAALVTSGTATLETCLLGTPQIVLYRMGGQRIARWVFEHFFSTPYISLVNLILGRLAIPELIGAEVTPRMIKKYLPSLLVDTPTRTMQEVATLRLRQQLGSQGASTWAANTILQHLGFS